MLRWFLVQKHMIVKVQLQATTAEATMHELIAWCAHVFGTRKPELRPSFNERRGDSMPVARLHASHVANSLRHAATLLLRLS